MQAVGYFILLRKMLIMCYRSGNRFRELLIPLPRGDQTRTPFSGLKDLSLDGTLLSWSDVSMEWLSFHPGKLTRSWI